MDLHYYSPHHTVNDADAKYDYLLGADEYPTWPAALQVIELVHLQKWSSEGASNLFKSLLDSAEQLPDLRRLVLHAHINIGWRDRVAFREQWIERLGQCFLDRSKPNPHLASFKAWRQGKGGENMATANLPPTPERVRRLSHVEILSRRSSTQSAEEPEEQSTQRRSRRIADGEAAAASLRKSGSATDAISISDGADTNQGSEGRSSMQSVQGLCDVVDIRIDNMRPREEQFHENDFLDSEESGDEDWNEGDEMPDEGYAW